MATLLNAVNSLLMARGLVPVNDLDSGHPMVVHARRLLLEHSEKIQHQKWWFNTETNVQLLRDGDDKVQLPSGVIQVDNTRHVIKGGWLYDIRNRTLTFEEDPPPLTLIYQREWEELPVVVRDYIRDVAKEEFIRPLESQLKTEMAERDTRASFARMQIADLSHKDVSVFTNPMYLQWRMKQVVR